jgi:peptidyl-prolyl cis-trans isomerase D
MVRPLSTFILHKVVMLGSFRKASKNWLGKVVVGILFTLLIASFAVWGIGDIFRGQTRNIVAVVGKTEISGESFRNALQLELQRISRQARQTVTPQQARLFGIDRQVLNRLVTEATFNEEAKRLKLDLSDVVVAKAIREDANFQGANGQFDRDRFNELLRSAGLTEAGYFAEQRAAMMRNQIVEALSAGITAPLAMQEASYRYGAERRSVEYIRLSPQVAGDIPAPKAEELEAFFKERSFEFRLPERRSLTLLTIRPDELVKTQTVTSEQIREVYEKGGQSRFGTPETRELEQIVFPSLDEARAASEKIKTGTSFDALVQERNLKPQDIRLGTFRRDEMFDPAVAEAAFALKVGEVSAPVPGRFGPLLIRAVTITPGTIKPFSEVEPAIRQELAISRARSLAETLHDQIEDMRAAARPITDIAREKNLPLTVLYNIDAQGLDEKDTRLDVADSAKLLAAVFQSDIGVDNEAVRLTGGGYHWFEVTKIDPARERTQTEAATDLLAAWRREQVSQKMVELARSLVEKLDKGEAFANLARGLGLNIQKAEGLGRGAAQGDLSADVLPAIFSTPVNKAGTVASAQNVSAGETRFVYRVISSAAEPYITSTQAAQTLQNTLRNALADDAVAAYSAHLQSIVGVQINENVLQRISGTDP